MDEGLLYMVKDVAAYGSRILLSIYIWMKDVAVYLFHYIGVAPIHRFNNLAT